MKGQASTAPSQTVMCTTPVPDASTPTREAMLPYARLTKEQEGKESITGVPEADNATQYQVKPYEFNECIALAINTMIGTGCFSLPYAFREAGILLTTCLLVAGSVLAMLSANYMMETLARLEGMTSSQEVTVSEKGDPAVVEKVAAPSLEAQSIPVPNHRITYRKFDYSTMCSILCNRYMKPIAQALVLFYIFGSMWAYASVFPSSVASYLHKQTHPTSSCTPSDENAVSSCMLYYYASLGIFALCVGFLALQELGDQAKIQQVLTVYRFVAIFVMLITMTMKLIFENDVTFSDVPVANMSKLGKGLGPTFLALGFHFSIPEILQPLNNKKKAQHSFLYSMTVSATLYFGIGFLGAITFGEKVNELVSINWNSYTGCGYGWSDCEGTHANWFGHIIKTMILLFPAINVASSYPVYALSLAENIITCLPASLQPCFQPMFVKKTFRLGTALVPLILAILFKKLDMIFTIVGLDGFLIALMIPAYFQRVSIFQCVQYWTKLPIEAASKTLYSLPVLSSYKSANLLLAVAIVAFSIATVSIL